ncbi:MAG: InlB B-repeat-containing protein [Lachnospiraceae bacterium]|nr:InlB B-repeat-containing protein [Lachnospiraceae bacterium]
MLKRVCFAVLLIIVLIVQEPCFSRARSLYEGERLQNIGFNDYPIEEYEEKSIEESCVVQLKYYLNGGTNNLKNKSFYRREELPVVLNAPVKEGYNFAGWYADSSFSHKITELTKENVKNGMLYAKWTKCIDNDYSVQMYAYQNKALENSSDKKLKNCEYNFLTQISIPGMPSTKEEDFKNNRITNTSQCPQGICLTEEYLLISSYSAKKRGNPGCIHVFDRITGEYLVSLGMKEKSHLGGLAFDGESIWVCHSDDNTLERIPYRFVQRAASRRTQEMVDCTNLFEKYLVSNSPSCVAYYEGKLWVATHTKAFNSQMISYKITEDGLKIDESYRIPEKVQGVAFDKNGMVYISTSYGRTKSSYLKVYTSLKAMDEAPLYPMLKVEMPPCSEEIVLENDRIFVLFESAAEKYFEGTDGKGTSISPIENVLAIRKSSIFQ